METKAETSRKGVQDDVDTLDTGHTAMVNVRSDYMVLTRHYLIYKQVHTSGRRVRVTHSISSFLCLRLHGLGSLTACKSSGFCIDGLDMMILENGVDIQCSLAT